MSFPLSGNLTAACVRRDAISARTKAALAAAKANGRKLRNYKRIANAKQRATAARAEAVRPAITATAHLSTPAAADVLNRRRVKTVSGKSRHAIQVRRLRYSLGPMIGGRGLIPRARRRNLTNLEDGLATEQCS
jgi:hypothetical protein